MCAWQTQSLIFLQGYKGLKVPIYLSVLNFINDIFSSLDIEFHCYSSNFQISANLNFPYTANCLNSTKSFKIYHNVCFVARKTDILF